MRRMIDTRALIAAREAKGLGQPELARLVGCSQQLISAIEKGTTRTTKYLPRIAMVLDVPAAQLDSDWGQPATIDPVRLPMLPVENLYQQHGRDFPVYSAAMGGPGEIIRSTEPVDWIPRPAPVQHVKQAYGQMVVGDSMFPEYEAGDTALVNPMLPILPAATCIFYHERDGEARATIKRLIRVSSHSWHVRQWNPPEGEPQDFTLDRHEWTVVHRVFGKHTRM